MKPKVLLVIGLYLCCMTGLAFAKDQTWDGWISDSKCGAKGANEKPVFVSDKDQKVVQVSNPDALQEHLGHHVQVSGTMDKDGTLHVDKVKMLAQSGGTGSGMSDMH